MAKQNGSRKVGRNKRSASMAAYAAQDRLSRNKKRRAARQSVIEGRHAAKAVAVTIKRKAGAVARLERRIAAGAKGLEGSMTKALAAFAVAQAEAR